MKLDDYLKPMLNYSIKSFKTDLDFIISVINKKLVPEYKSVTTSITDDVRSYESCTSAMYFQIGDISITSYGEIEVFEDNSGYLKFDVIVGDDETGLPFPFGAVKRAAEFLRDTDPVKFCIDGEPVEL